MSGPWFEVLVAGAERQFAEAGKMQNLSFWAFKILVRARRPEYQTPPLYPRTYSQGEPENFKISDGYVDYCAWRRYSDLEWFRTHLALEYPGVVLPPIPEKDAGAGTSDKVKDLVKSDKGPKETAANNPLIAQRIRRLQLFFNGVVALNEVYASEHLKAFVSMEEAEWVKYKVGVEAKLNPAKGWNKVKATGFGLFSAVKSLTATKMYVFDEISGLGKIRKQQLEMANALMVSSRQISNMLKAAHPKESKDPHQLDGVNLNNAGKSLPPSLVYNGHLVASGGKTGTVRHVDETEFAWVDFGDEGGKLKQVNVNQLSYPNTGVCDPAAVAVHHHLTQMESYFAYVGRTQLGQDALKLQDSIWFEGQFCQSVAENVNAVEDIEKKRLALTKTIASEKDASKRAAMEAEAATLQTTFAQQCTKVSQDYDRVFRPRQRRALAIILPQIGPLMAGLLNDDDWDNRLAPADASLPLLFDVPEEVIQAQRKAKLSEETRKEPKTAAPTPTMPAAVAQQQQQHPQDPQRRHHDPFAAEDMGTNPYQPPKEAAPTPTPYSPPASQQEQEQADQRPEQTAPSYRGGSAVTSSIEDAPVESNVTAAPPAEAVFSMPPPDHDEEPPPPPTEEEEEVEGPSATEGAQDDVPPSEEAAADNTSVMSLAGPKREEQSEPEWDGEGPPPIPDAGDHDV